MDTDVNPTDDPREFEEFQLSLYLDGQLDDASRAALEKRIATEPDLKARLDELRRLDTLVREHAERAPVADPDTFVADVRRRRAMEQPRRPSLLFRLAVPMAAAAAILLVVTALRTGPSEPGPGTDTIATVRVGPAIDGSAMAPVVQVSFSRGRPTKPVARPASLLVATAGSFGSGSAYGVVEEEMPVF
jgi:anti-sigma factor RsiW